MKKFFLLQIDQNFLWHCDIWNSLSKVEKVWQFLLGTKMLELNAGKEVNLKILWRFLLHFDRIS